MRSNYRRTQWNKEFQCNFPQSISHHIKPKNHDRAVIYGTRTVERTETFAIFVLTYFFVNMNSFTYAQFNLFTQIVLRDDTELLRLSSVIELSKSSKINPITNEDFSISRRVKICV